MHVVQDNVSDRLRQAERRLDWAQSELVAMDAAALRKDADGCERAFSRILSDINIAFEALRNSSKRLDGGEAALLMAEDRRKDPLLFYFWHARNVDVHHVLERRISAGSRTITVFDPAKLAPIVEGAVDDDEADRRILCAAVGISDWDEQIDPANMPTEETLEAIGLRWVDEEATLSLLAFTYVNDRGETIVVSSPDSHLGAGISTWANRASAAAIAYYRSILEALREINSVMGPRT